MSDTVLLNVKMLVESNVRQADKDDTVVLCHNLLYFSYEKGLLLKNPFQEEKLDIETIIKESDLTEKGKQIFDDLAEKWFAYTDRTNKIDNVSMLEKWFSKM